MDEHAWQPIETAPKDGTRILCYWPSYAYNEDEEGSPEVLIAWWAENDRIEKAHKEGLWLDSSVGYFKSCWEWDDYGLSHKEHAPTHWMPLPLPPATP